MKMLHKSALAACALGLMTAACGDNTQAQDEVDAQAEAIDKSYEAQADVVEALGEGAPDEAEAKQQADALREKGEQIKDDLKDEADELDKVPGN